MKKLMVEDKNARVIWMAETDYAKHIPFNEIIDALTYDLNVTEPFVIPDDLDLVVTGFTYYLYLGDILIRVYDPAESLYHMQCFFEEVSYIALPHTASHALVVNVGYR